MIGLREWSDSAPQPRRRRFVSSWQFAAGVAFAIAAMTAAVGLYTALA